MLAFLLLSGAAQTQIHSLTSGTSASHNRVKTRDLAEISLPFPRDGSASAERLFEIVSRYQHLLVSITESHRSLVEIRERETAWVRESALER